MCSAVCRRHGIDFYNMTMWISCKYKKPCVDTGAEWESSSQPDYPVSFRMVPDQGGEVSKADMHCLIERRDCVQDCLHCAWTRYLCSLSDSHIHIMEQVTAFNILNGSETGTVPTRVQVCCPSCLVPGVFTSKQTPQFQAFLLE